MLFVLFYPRTINKKDLNVVYLRLLCPGYILELIL